MKKRLNTESRLANKLLAALTLITFVAGVSTAQVPVDESGEIIGEYSVQSPSSATGNEDIPLLSTVDLEELVGPIALYPDDLLAIVLPASAYPLQIVDAARFLEALENDPSLEPNPDWDDSIIALINYPEVVELLNEDIDWTWRLGEAVVSQQADVVAAVETFRDRAYAAGNLKSDSYQNVTRDKGIIEIVPIAEDVIYVPYYEPERVVVYQPRPVYYYYPRPCPVYYYPYSSSHAFDRRFFWGVTTAFSIGWRSDRLNVFHHSYHGHPYYGRSYWNRWWYRRPTMNVHNTTYVGNNTNVTINRYYGGDRWRPRENRHDYIASGTRVTRNRQYRGAQPAVTSNRAPAFSEQRQSTRNNTVRNNTVRNNTNRREPVRDQVAEQRRERSARETAVRERNVRKPTARQPITFRERPETTARNNRDTVQFRQRDNSGQLRRNERSDARDRTTQHRIEPKKRRLEPSPKLQSPDPKVQARRNNPARQVSRAEPRHQVRRVEPQRKASRTETQRQVRRAEPQRKASRTETQRQVRRAEPQRQEKAATKSAQRSSERKSEGRSDRRSAGRRSEDRGARTR